MENRIIVPFLRFLVVVILLFIIFLFVFSLLFLLFTYPYYSYINRTERKELNKILIYFGNLKLREKVKEEMKKTTNGHYIRVHHRMSETEV